MLGAGDDASVAVVMAQIEGSSDGLSAASADQHLTLSLARTIGGAALVEGEDTEGRRVNGRSVAAPGLGAACTVAVASVLGAATAVGGALDQLRTARLGAHALGHSSPSGPTAHKGSAA